MTNSFPRRLAQAAIAYHEVGQFGDSPEIRIIGRESAGHYTHDTERNGYWVQAEVFVPAHEIEPEPGPTYDVWIAEPGAHTLARALGGFTEHHKPWAWQSCGTTFTCDDDPDGKGARHFAHDYARHLRATYPCAFVAVRRADKGLPPPVRCE
jgi:hypothetical protein